MEFKVGDLVVCRTPVSELNLDEIYEVEAVVGRCKETDVYSLKLKNVINAYSSFRFKPTGTQNLKFEEPIVEFGASKNDQEKVDLSLIPLISNLEHAKAFMVGEKKYGRYNYCKGHKASQLIAAAERHLQAWFNGESHDPIDGQHHLGSAMACCSMILRQEELGTLKDDRYKKPNQ